MNMFTNATNQFIKNYDKNKPAVYAGLAVAASIGGAVSAVVVTKRASELMKQMKAEEAQITNTDEIKKHRIKRYLRVARMYAPVVCLEALAVSSVITGYKVSASRTAAFATAYMITKDDFQAYKQKAVEIVGQKKADSIEHDASVAKIKDEPVPEETEIISTGNGNTLFYDKIGGRYFRSSIDAVRTAEKAIIANIHSYDSASVNEFYYELGLEDTVAGDVLGWNTDKPLNIKLNSTRLSDNNEPAFVIEYEWVPLVAYDQICY